MGDTMLNLENGKPVNEAEIRRAVDPVLPGVTTPGDFAAQYPQPLDVTEIITMCEEVTVLRTLPEKRTALNGETWRELTTLAFVTGSNLIAFTDGQCPETYSHDGSNTTVNHKNIGAYKSLTLRDIMHSQAVASANWNGINTLVGGYASGEGMPGAVDYATFTREHIANLKEKEMRLAATLVLNGWDRLLVSGDATVRPLEFDGIERYFVNVCSTEHVNSNTASGSFSAASFDRFLSEGCAKPTHVFGHPTAIQEMLGSYFALGFAAAPQQVINFQDGNRVVPGYNFAGFVNTGIGKLTVVADDNFQRLDAGGGNFQSKLYALRMTHNGEPLVYKSTQVPMSFQDLAPGCTAIAFEVWAATALIIKACCAHGVYTSQFTGRTTGVTECTAIG